MKANEILNTLAKPWLTTQDIMKIADLSRSVAGTIKRNIEKEFKDKNPNKYLPSNCVPTKYVIKYFDIDIEFIKGLASIKWDYDKESSTTN